MVNRTTVLRVSAVLSLVLQGTTAFAQWDGAISGINSLYDAIGKLMMVVMGIGALVVLVMIILRLMNGDKEAATKLFWWLIGLSFGFIMVAALSSLKF